MPDGDVRIGVIGDYDASFRPHRVVEEVLEQAAEALGVEVRATWIPTRSLEGGQADSALTSFHGLWCSPGSPYRSLEGALEGIRVARVTRRPFLGTCAGFQHAVVEYARNVMGHEQATSAQYDPDGQTLFITPLECSVAGRTLRVGVVPGTRAYGAYGRAEIQEYYYCGFGLNPAFRNALEEGGFRVSGTDDTGEARIIELPDHPFFVATLFVPGDSAALPSDGGGVEIPHRLITSYVQAARPHKSAVADTASRQTRSR